MSMDAPRLARKIMEDRKEIEMESKLGGSFLSCYNEESHGEQVTFEASSTDDSFYKAISEVDHLRQRLLDRAAGAPSSSHMKVSLPILKQRSPDVTDIFDDLIGSDNNSSSQREREEESRKDKAGSGKLSKAKSHLERAQRDIYNSNISKKVYAERDSTKESYYDNKNNDNINHNNISHDNNVDNNRREPMVLQPPKNGGLTPLSTVDSDYDYFNNEDFISKSPSSSSSIDVRNSDISTSLLRRSFSELNKSRNSGGINHTNVNIINSRRLGTDWNTQQMENFSRSIESICIDDVLADALNMPASSSTSSIHAMSQYERSIHLVGDQESVCDGDDLVHNLKNLLGDLEDQIHMSQKNLRRLPREGQNNLKYDDVHDAPVVASPLVSSALGTKYNLKESDNSYRLALATAAEAGDTAGRLLAEMMAARSAYSSSPFSMTKKRC